MPGHVGLSSAPVVGWIGLQTLLRDRNLVGNIERLLGNCHMGEVGRNGQTLECVELGLWKRPPVRRLFDKAEYTRNIFVNTDSCRFRQVIE